MVHLGIGCVVVADETISCLEVDRMTAKLGSYRSYLFQMSLMSHDDGFLNHGGGREGWMITKESRRGTNLHNVHLDIQVIFVLSMPEKV